MARPLRIEFAGAIYDVMSRGNARQKIFRDERDYGRFWEGWEATIDKFRFELFGSVCMPNHVHLFFRAPEPNFSRGMQYLLSGYATWFSTRHRRPGHLLQGRYKGELSEDERYFWNVIRDLHLNPVRGKRPESAYWRYVDEGMVKPPANPLADAVEGWLLGAANSWSELSVSCARPSTATKFRPRQVVWRSRWLRSCHRRLHTKASNPRVLPQSTARS